MNRGVTLKGILNWIFGLKDILFWGPFLLLFIVVGVFVVYPAYVDYKKTKTLELQTIQSENNQK